MATQRKVAKDEDGDDSVQSSKQMRGRYHNHRLLARTLRSVICVVNLHMLLTGILILLQHFVKNRSNQRER